MKKIRNGHFSENVIVKGTITAEQVLLTDSSPLVGMYNTNYPVANQDGTVLFTDQHLAINDDTAAIGKPPGMPFPDLLGLPALGLWKKTDDLSYLAQFTTIYSDKSTGSPLLRFKLVWTITMAPDGLTFNASQQADVYAVNDIQMTTSLNTLITPVYGVKIVF